MCRRVGNAFLLSATVDDIGAGPRTSTVESQLSKREPRRMKGSRTQNRLSAMANKSCVASEDRNSERKPDIALEKQRKKAALVLAS